MNANSLFGAFPARGSARVAVHVNGDLIPIVRATYDRRKNLVVLQPDPFELLVSLEKLKHPPTTDPGEP